MLYDYRDGLDASRAADATPQIRHDVHSECEGFRYRSTRQFSLAARIAAIL